MSIEELERTIENLQEEIYEVESEKEEIENYLFDLNRTMVSYQEEMESRK